MWGVVFLWEVNIFCWPRSPRFEWHSLFPIYKRWVGGRTLWHEMFPRISWPFILCLGDVCSYVNATIVAIELWFRGGGCSCRKPYLYLPRSLYSQRVFSLPHSPSPVCCWLEILLLSGNCWLASWRFNWGLFAIEFCVWGGSLAAVTCLRL